MSFSKNLVLGNVENKSLDKIIEGGDIICYCGFNRDKITVCKDCNKIPEKPLVKIINAYITGMKTLKRSSCRAMGIRLRTKSINASQSLTFSVVMLEYDKWNKFYCFE